MTSAKTISNGMTDQSLLKLLRCSPFFAKVLISNRFFVPLQRILTKVDFCRDSAIKVQALTARTLAKN